MINRDYLKPAAIAAGLITAGERFGFHAFRHSLCTWVNMTLKDIKISQSILRHSKPELTAGVYTHGVAAANLNAQRQYVAALGLERPASRAVQ
jgi:integrase